MISGVFNCKYEAFSFSAKAVGLIAQLPRPCDFTFCHVLFIGFRSLHQAELWVDHMLMCAVCNLFINSVIWV